MKKVIFAFAVLFCFISIVPVMAGSSVKNPVPMIIDIPNSIDDPALTSVTSHYSWNTSGYCVGEDGSPVEISSVSTVFYLDIYVPKLTVWNMNGLHFSAKSISDDGGLPSDYYYDQNIRKNPDTHTATIYVAEKYCWHKEPGVAYYNYDYNSWICAPLEEEQCDVHFNLTGKGYLSILD